MKRKLLSVMCVFCLGSSLVIERPRSPEVEEIRPGVLAGYLGIDDLPDSVMLVPPPPELDSFAARHDIAVAEEALASRPERRRQAIEDADVGFPQATLLFTCALQTKITERDTPNLYRLLRRSRTDAAASVDAAKDRYQRLRPFMVNDAPICTPEKQQGLAANGSYPSGHAAIGWAWALILAELAPDRADAVFSKGMQIGDSRIACNVHWRSDVDQGRFVAGAVVARLHGSQEFRADMELARKEFVRAREANPVSDSGCTKSKVDPDSDG
ncbi:MAG: phosphatase PAP2 family protein [Pseudoxanthomonas sp.]